MLNNTPRIVANMVLRPLHFAIVWHPQPHNAATKIPESVIILCYLILLIYVISPVYIRSMQQLQKDLSKQQQQGNHKSNVPFR